MPTPTTHYSLQKPDTGQPGWAGLMNTNLDNIDATLHDHDTRIDTIEASGGAGAHAPSHATGGTDPLTPAAIGAADAVHGHDNLTGTGSITGYNLISSRNSTGVQIPDPAQSSGFLYINAPGNANGMELEYNHSARWLTVGYWNNTDPDYNYPILVRFPANTAQDANIGLNTGTSESAFGAGQGVIAIGEASTVPTGNPTGAIYTYVEGGLLKYRSPNGTIHTLTNSGGGGSTPLASSTTSGTVKTDVNEADPVVYTRASVDTALAGKAATSHTHDDRYYTEAETDALLGGKAATSHTHAIADTTGLQAALDGKAATAHAHSGADITSGTVGPAYLGTGTRDGTKFLRDDGAWTAVSGGGGGSVTVQEVDGTPSVAASTLIFPNGTLTDNGGGSVTYTPAASGGSAVDPLTTARFTDDFIGGSAASDQVGQLRWRTSGGTLTNWSATGALSNHPGVIQRTSSATANTIAAMWLANGNSEPFFLMNATWDMTWIIGYWDGGDEVSPIRCGVSDTGNTARPANGIYVEKMTADTNFHAVCRAASVETRVDLGVARATFTWYRLRIRRVGANDVRFSINGGAETTITTNIPGTVAGTAWFLLTNETAVNRKVQIDFFDMQISGLSR